MFRSGLSQVVMKVEVAAMTVITTVARVLVKKHDMSFYNKIIGDINQINKELGNNL